MCKKWIKAQENTRYFKNEKNELSLTKKNIFNT